MSAQFDFEDWTENFIKAVKGKPGLYNRALKEYSDKNAVARLWSEVCKTVVPAWKGLNAAERELKEKEFQQKWRNLRTSFRREIKLQKQGMSTKGARKRRKYIYFEQLLFLLPYLEDKEATSKTSRPVGETEDEEVYQNEAPATNKKRAKRKAKTKEPPYEGRHIEVEIEREKPEEFDEDKLFLLSLVPTFKKMTGSQKIDVKMAILSVIKQVTEPAQITELQ